MMKKAEDFGTTTKGQKTHLYEIGTGILKAKVTDFGATLVSYTIERNGSRTDIVLGYDDVTGYEENVGALGAVVGRNANRTKGAAFELNGKKYKLSANVQGKLNLHSGPDVYFKRLYETDGVSPDGSSITFRLHSPHLDQGFPGNLDFSVTYSLNDEEGLKLTYRGLSDQDTIFNPTNHAYFNLNGEGDKDITKHLLMVHAKSFTPTDEEQVPVPGEQIYCAGTSFDFQVPKLIGADIDDLESPQQAIGHGYDHNFVLAEQKRDKVEPAALLLSPASNLGLEISTDLPGIQVYSANYLDIAHGKGGKPYPRRSALALETQFTPNAINDPYAASPVIKAGVPAETTTIYRLFQTDHI